MNEKNQMKINFDIIMTETRREIEETKLMVFNFLLLKFKKAIENVKEKNNEIEELNEMAKKNVSLLHEQNDNLKGQVEFLQGEVH
jgi:hypothetical protein